LLSKNEIMGITNATRKNLLDFKGFLQATEMSFIVFPSLKPLLTSFNLKFIFQAGATSSKTWRTSIIPISTISSLSSNSTLCNYEFNIEQPVSKNGIKMVLQILPCAASNQTLHLMPHEKATVLNTTM
jgi:hypothetical protein